MATPVTVYRWDDVGAPPLVNGKPSELINILQKCLVDGYGTKTPLGWTKEFEDVASQKVVFRNNVSAGGSGGYCQFYSNNGTDGNNTLLNTKPAQTMSGLDTYIKGSYISGIQAVSSTWKAWVLIGTPTAFYFIVCNPNGAMGERRGAHENVIYVGDFKPYIPNDASRFIASGTPLTNGDYTPTILNYYGYMFNDLWSSQYTRANYGSHVLYGTDGSPEFYDYGLIIGDHFFYEYTLNLTGQRKGLYRTVMIGHKGEYSNSIKRDYDNNLIMESVKWPLFRGELQGMVTELCSHVENPAWPYTETHLGYEHFALRSTGMTICAWINMVEWD
jgi:hypothetical protein